MSFNDGTHEPRGVTGSCAVFVCPTTTGVKGLYMDEGESTIATTESKSAGESRTKDPPFK